VLDLVKVPRDCATLRSREKSVNRSTSREADPAGLAAGVQPLVDVLQAVLGAPGDLQDVVGWLGLAVLHLPD
jgi:hypothetical protein